MSPPPCLPCRISPRIILTLYCRLISGGSDGTLKLWDLEQTPNPSQSHTYCPVGAVARAGSGSPGHRFGITHLSFYPFDSAAFLSSSHDQTLKLWSTERASVSGSFDLGARVYTHATSPIASHLLVACGTQHPAVRLVDLRSAAAVQSLVSPGQIGGSAGATLAVAWSPVHGHVLATGSVDGAVRIWDVRKSNGLVALLDQEDVVGLADEAEIAVLGAQRHPRPSARAHAGPVNGLTWTDDGTHLVSAGHDRRIRVWDAVTGANTLANFGPSIRNSQMGAVGMFVSPTGLTQPGTEVLFFPNETEILAMNLHEGSIITRLRTPGLSAPPPGQTLRGGQRPTGNRATSCECASSSCLGKSRGFFSAPLFPVADIVFVDSGMEGSRGKWRFDWCGYGREQRSGWHLQWACGWADPGLAPAAPRRRRRNGRQLHSRSQRGQGQEAEGLGRRFPKLDGEANHILRGIGGQCRSGARLSGTQRQLPEPKIFLNRDDCGLQANFCFIWASQPFPFWYLLIVYTVEERYDKGESFTTQRNVPVGHGMPACR